MNRNKYVVLAVSIVVLLVAFLLTKNVTPGALEEIGGMLPLPLFTLLIALVDGFNPCNLFVLTMLISLMLTESHSRRKILAVGYSFIAVVYGFYFLFMAAWLNIFRYIGFIDPLRIGIGVLAIVAGLINCKEYFFFRKGITLMVQDRHVGPLKKRIADVAHKLRTGSMPALVAASVMLAIFASLVELPCTAGFPIIYTGILAGHGMASGLGHYLYLLLYNIFYVMPLLVIVTVIGYTFHGKQIEKSTMALIKFIGGLIMLMLGMVLLVNPGLIGL